MDSTITVEIKEDSSFKYHIHVPRSMVISIMASNIAVQLSTTPDGQVAQRAVEIAREIDRLTTSEALGNEPN